MRKLVYLLAIIASLFLINNVKATSFNIQSNNAILYNVEENTVMYQKNENQRAQIASLTKVLSALVILEKTNNLDQSINLDNTNDEFLKKHEDK